LSINKEVAISVIVILAVAFVFVMLVRNYGSIPSADKEVPHEAKWGIYVLDLENEDTELLFSSSNEISRLRLDHAGDKLAFSQQIDNGSECVVEGSPINLCEEICSIRVDGNGYVRLTHNSLWIWFPAGPLMIHRYFFFLSVKTWTYSGWMLMAATSLRFMILVFMTATCIVQMVR
jgi:hypothetical protein